MKKYYNKINDYIGDKLSDGLSTMEVFYLVVIMVLLPLCWQVPTSLIAWVQYLSSTILQAVALPLLAYTTKKSGESQEKIIRETHDVLMNELDLIQELHKAQLELMEEIKKLVK